VRRQPEHRRAPAPQGKTRQRVERKPVSDGGAVGLVEQPCQLRGVQGATGPEHAVAVVIDQRLIGDKGQ